jgi:hypothetical protein
MNVGVLVVLSQPLTSARDAEFNEWYEGQHIPDMLRVPGFVRASRYRVATSQLLGDTEAPARYLAIYEIDAEDVRAARDALLASAGSMQVGDALDVPTVEHTFFEAVSVHEATGRP